MSPENQSVFLAPERGDLGHSSRFETVGVSFTKAVLVALNKHTRYVWLPAGGSDAGLFPVLFCKPMTKSRSHWSVADAAEP